MSCEKVRVLIASLVDRRPDGGSPAETREEALAHVAECRVCAVEYENVEWQRRVMRSLATAPVPAKLEAKLRVMASYERSRTLTRLTWRARWEAMRARLALEFENMMKPVALPVAGGLISAMFMFGVLIPSVSYARIKSIEPPTPVFTEPDGQVVGEGEFPKLESPNVPMSGKVVVLLIIDDRGRVKDYHVTQGTITPEVQNFIMFSLFTPATIFGTPTWGQVQAVFGDESSDPRS